MEAASKELGRELEEIKRAADNARGAHEAAKSEIDEKKSLGLFAGTVGERHRQRLNGVLNNAKCDLDTATAAASAKSSERSEANRQMNAQKEVIMDMKADWEEAKKVLDSFTRKGAEVTKTCPGCTHADVTKNDKSSASVQRYACRCTFLNWSSCPVCIPRRKPNLLLTKEVMDACPCNISRCNCLCAIWLATLVARVDAKQKAEEYAANFLADNPKPSRAVLPLFPIFPKPKLISP